MSTANSSGAGRSGKPRSIGMSIVIVVLAIAYIQAGPWLSRKLGVSLPGIDPPAKQAADAAGTNPGDLSGTPAKLPETNNPIGDTSKTTKSGETDRPEPRKFPESGSGPGKNDAKNKTPSDGFVGGLKSYGRVYVSRAGLRYTPGSQEGHRLKHVLRHIRDIEERSVHGVFDAKDQAELVAIIDEAYQKIRGSARGVKSERERDRMVHTVDMGRRVGYLGGMAGRRNNHPPCNKVKLILEDQDVITAYPVNR